jgi:hypothetical protein
MPHERTMEAGARKGIIREKHLIISDPQVMLEGRSIRTPIVETSNRGVSLGTSSSLFLFSPPMPLEN